MLFSTIGQGWVFLWMVAAGAAIGVWYAQTAALRRLLRAGLWLSLAADAAFGAAAGFALFAAAAFLPAKRAAAAAVAAVRRIFVKIGRFRWIKVIFR